MTRASRRAFALGAVLVAGVWAGAGALAPAGAKAAERWQLDPSYGRGGVAVVPRNVGGEQFVPSLGFALDRLGGIVADSQGTGTAVARITPAGRLDTGFGRRGVGRFKAPGQARAMQVTAVAPSRAGGVLLGGGDGGGAVVARITSAGRLDPGFGTRGFAHLHEPALLVFEIAERPGGALAVAASSTAVCPVPVYGLTRSGQRDRSFNAGRPAEGRGCGSFALAASAAGVFAYGASTPPGRPSTTAALTVLSPAGKHIRTVLQGASGLLVGTTRAFAAPGGVLTVATLDRLVSGEPACAGVIAARFSAAGARDWTFASGARPGLAGCYRSAAAQPDGSLLLARSFPRPALTLTRLTPRGRLDPAFGASGTITIPSLPAGAYDPGRLIARGSRTVYVTGTAYVPNGDGGSSPRLFAAKLIRTR